MLGFTILLFVVAVDCMEGCPLMCITGDGVVRTGSREFRGA